MNKVIMSGRLTKDVEVRYTQSATPLAVASYSIAVRRQFAKQGEPDVDFINVVSFGKAAEFVSKYFSKGSMINICGRLQTEQWEKDGVKQYGFKIIAEEQYFCGGKNEEAGQQTFNPVPQNVEEEDLPF